MKDLISKSVLWIAIAKPLPVRLLLMVLLHLPAIPLLLLMHTWIVVLWGDVVVMVLKKLVVVIDLYDLRVMKASAAQREAAAARRLAVAQRLLIDLLLPK